MADIFHTLLRRGGDNSSKSSSAETWILGTRYGSQQKERVRRHSASLIRLTYRCKFPAMLPYADVTSDSGWGCMLRTAQMLMAQGLQRDMLGRDWRIPTNANMLRFTPEYREIIKWFLDYPGPPYVYSIHHLVQCGMRYDKLPGEWYGPSTAAHVLKDLASIHRRIFRGTLEVCVAQDGIVYKSEVERVCTSVVTHAYPSTGSLDGDKKSHISDDDLKMHVKERMTDGTLSEDSTYAIVAVGDSPEITSNDAIEETLSCNDPQDLLVKKTVIQSDILDGLMIVEKVLAPTTLTLVDVAKPSEQPLTASNSSKVISSNIFGPKQKSLKGNAIATKEGNDFFDPLFNPPPLPPKQPWAASLMLIVPLRLGKDKTDPENFHAIKSLFRSKYTLGIMGGWVGHAVFFVGYRGNKLLGLDPHTTYNCPPPWHSSLSQDSFPSDKLLEEIHVENLQEMEFSQLDPSVAIAFYFRDREEFDSFCRDKADHTEVLEKHGPSGVFGSKVVTRPLNPTVAVAAGSVQKNKKPFDIFIAAKHHYFSLFGILDTMPTLEDVLGESVGDGKHKEDWEIDSHGDDDDEDDEEFIIV